jgi:hypothetical protein
MNLYSCELIFVVLAEKWIPEEQRCPDYSCYERSPEEEFILHGSSDKEWKQRGAKGVEDLYANCD